MSHRKFVVIGDITLDWCYPVQPMRTAPRDFNSHGGINKGLEIDPEFKAQWTLGGAGNVAVQLWQLGGDVSLFGFEPNQALFNIHTESAQDYAAWKQQSSQCGFTFRRYTDRWPHGEQLSRQRFVDPKAGVVYERVDQNPSSLCDLKMASFLKSFETEVSCASLVIICDNYSHKPYGLFASPSIRSEVLRVLNKHNKPHIIDPSLSGRLDFWGKPSGFRVVTPNLNEARQCLRNVKGAAVYVNCEPLGNNPTIPVLEVAAEKIRAEASADLAVITDGERGAVWSSTEATSDYSRCCVAFPVQPRSQFVGVTVGAGDAFVVSLAWRYFSPRKTLTDRDGGAKEIVQAGVDDATAAVVSWKFGMPCRVDPERFKPLKQEAPEASPSTGVKQTLDNLGCEFERLLPHITRAREEGRKIVFTNGIFDLFHEGHLHLLEACHFDVAKHFCFDKDPFVVVAVNGDASAIWVRKGKIPVFRQRARLDLVRACRYVDAAILFHDADPGSLVKEIKPDVYVKGSDWAAYEADKAPALAEHTRSGRFAYFVKREFDESTTSVIERIKGQCQNC